MATKIKKMNNGWAKTVGIGEYQDETEPCLFFYVTPTSRSWGFYRWSPFRRKPERRSIGALHDFGYEAAKQKAALIKAEQIEHGYLQPKKRIDPTVEVTLEKMAKLYTQKLRGEGADFPTYLEDAITWHFEKWLKKPFASITHGDLFDRHQAIAADPDRGPMAATRAITCMRSLYNYAIRSGKYRGENLAKYIKVKPQGVRRRVILPAEYKKIMEELDNPAHEPWIPAYFRLAMLTGARRDNLAGMEWADLDLAEGLWHIPAESAKAGDPITIPLLPEAVEILKGRVGLHDKWVFPSPRSSLGRLRDPFYAWKRVLENAGVKTDITVHDIRRTFGSKLAAQGVSLSVIAEAMGHRSTATTAKHYIVNPAGAVRDALTRVLG